jgi:hypothetical protein
VSTAAHHTSPLTSNLSLLEYRPRICLQAHTRASFIRLQTPGASSRRLLTHDALLLLLLVLLPGLVSLHVLEILILSCKAGRAGREPHFILAQGRVERTLESALELVAYGVRA